MKNITNLIVTQIRIFKVDVVPLTLIRTRLFIDKLRDLFSFADVESRPSIDGKDTITFRSGILKNNKITIINRIEIDQRRVILEVEGTSTDANKVYDMFVSSFSTVTEFDNNTLNSPVLKTEATQCVVELDFTLDMLFNETFIKFLNTRITKKSSNKIAKATVNPMGASAEIKYEILDSIINDNKISINSKLFNIIPRPGLPLIEKKYLISSPFDSDTHIKTIKELNKAIISGRK